MAFNIEPFKLVPRLDQGQLFKDQHGYPTHLQLAMLCEQVSSLRPAGSLITLRNDGGEWRIIRNSYTNLNIFMKLFGKQGYFGAAYYNARFGHLVIAFKGTNAGTSYLDFMSEIKSDLRIGFGRLPKNLEKAYKFTKEIVTEFKNQVLSISITGHSLGGFIASTSSFYMKHGRFLQSDQKQVVDNPSEHLHTVTFDSPAAKFVFERHFTRQELRLDGRHFIDLDLTTYLLDPNFINSWNDHVGTLLYLPGGFHLIKDIIASLATTVKPKLEILDWPFGGFETIKVRWDKYWKTNPSTTAAAAATVTSNVTPFHFAELQKESCKLVLFTEIERLILKTILNLKEQHGGGDEETFDDATLCEIVKLINPHTNTSSPSVHEIACVRNLINLLSSFEVIDEGHTVRLKAGYKIDEFMTAIKCLNYNKNLLPFLTTFLFASGSRIQLSAIPDVAANDDIQRVQGQLKLIIENHFAHMQDISKTKKKRSNNLVNLIVSGDTFIPSTYLYSIARAITKQLQKSLVMVSSQQGISPLLNYMFETPRTLSSADVLLIDCSISSPSSSTTDSMNWVGKLASLTSAPERLTILISNMSLNGRDTNNFDLHGLEAYHFPTFNLDHLTETSKKLVLNLKFNLQGHQVAFQPKKDAGGVLLQNANELFDWTVLRSVNNGQRLSIGKRLEEMPIFEKQYYMTRIFRKPLFKVGQSLSHLNNDTILLFSVTTQDGIQKLRSYSPTHVNAQLSVDTLVQMVNEHQKCVVFLSECGTVEIFKTLCTHYSKATLDTSKTIHWFQEEEEEDNNQVFVWQETFFKSGANDRKSHTRWDMEFDKEKCNKHWYTEEQILTLSNKLIVLIDEPGMGKTVSMRQLSLMIKFANPTKWVLFIDLDSNKSLLAEIEKEYDSSSINLNIILKFLYQVENETSNFGKQLLTRYLQLEQQVVILFDGLDEIEPSSRALIIKICNILRLQTKCCLLIASRLHTEYLLTNGLHTTPIHLNRLNEGQRREYFIKFWTHHPQFIQKYSIVEESQIKPLQVFVNKILEEIEYVGDPEFIGVPLQLFMFATIYFRDFMALYQKMLERPNNKSSEEEIIVVQRSDFKEINNMLHLYELFQREKYNLCLDEKCHYPILEGWDERELIQGYEKLHRAAGFQSIYPPSNYTITKELTMELDELDLNKLKQIGIVKSDLDVVEKGKKEEPTISTTSSSSSSSSPFIHRSLAECCTAEVFVLRLMDPTTSGQTLAFLQEPLELSSTSSSSCTAGIKLPRFIHPDFDKIRYFIDHILAFRSETSSVLGVELRHILRWKRYWT